MSMSPPLPPAAVESGVGVPARARGVTPPFGTKRPRRGPVAPLVRKRPEPQGPLRTLLLTGVGLYVALLVAAPVMAIVASAFARGPFAFVHALFAEGGAEALGLSLGIAVVAVAVNTVFGIIVAWVLTRDRFWGRSFLNALVDLPFAVSPVIVGLALILLFGPQGWFGSLLARAGIKIVFAWPGMALATIFVSLPFVVRQVSQALSDLPHEQEEAAATLGAGGWLVFWHVTLPNIRGGLVNGVLLTTARCLGEFGAVLVVSGGVARMSETGTLFIYRSLEERRDLGAYAMAFALAVLSLSLLLAAELLKRRRTMELGGHRR